MKGKIKYTIRPASEADYTYCYRITKRNMFNLFFRHWGGWVPSEFRKSFNPDNVSIVMVSGRRAGYLSATRDAQGIYIENIQLSPSLHGHGIGTSILKGLLDQHVQEAVRLTTFSDNPARRLYERLGFMIAETQGQTLVMIRKRGCGNFRGQIL